MEKEDKAVMLLFLNPILFCGFVYKKEYVLSFIVFMFMFFQIRRCLRYIKTREQAENKTEEIT